MTATIASPNRSAPAGLPPRAATPRPTSGRPRRSGGGPANLALCALTLSAAAALSRLFTHPAPFLIPVAAVAVAVHLVAWGCRRLRLELLPSAVLSAVGGVVVTSWVSLGHTTAYGLPWRGTYHALGPALQTAADAYRSTSPPTAVVTGFVIAGSFGIGCAAFLGDWAAFRMRASIEACLPSFSLFVLSAALAQGHRVIVATVVYLAALMLFLLSRQGAVDSPATAWFASRSRRGAGSVVAVGAVAIAAAVGFIGVVGPHLPGATTHALIDWRRGTSGNGGRSTASPLVDIKDRLHAESQQEVFTVKTRTPTYWRITALDDFNGSGWSLDDTYRRAGSTLGPAPVLLDPGPTRTEDATFKITGLDSLWLPAAYRATTITPSHGVSYSAEAASLITNKATSDGETYTVTSAVPAVTPGALDQSVFMPVGDPTVARYLQLPAGLAGALNQIAEQHIGGASTPYQMALDLQDWLRGPQFRYSLNVAADDSPNALIDFLTHSRAGFCQQFAAAFAALGRSVGLPTRVAVGFTPGNLESDGLYHVRDSDAHAWPEVYFQDIGWIAFEPTPGRGSPDQAAQAITGQKPAQAPDVAPTTTPGSPATTTPAGNAAPAIPKANGQAGAAPKPKVTQHQILGVSGALRYAAVPAGGIVAALLWALALWLAMLAVGARRWSRARSARAQVALAWREAGEALAGVGTPARPWETPAEFAQRAMSTADLPGSSRDALGELAASFEMAAYAPAGPDDTDAAEARAAAHEIRIGLTTARPWWARLAGLLDPRPLWRMVSRGA